MYPQGYSVYEEDGVKYYYTLLGVQGTARGQKWFSCSSCGFSFPEDEGRKWKGIQYCQDCFSWRISKR